MKKIILGFVVASIVGGTAVPRSPAATHETPTPAVAGLAFAQPKSIALAPEVPGYGRVLDPAPFRAGLTELETARAAATASAQEFTRVRKLHEENANASAQAVETAESAKSRDQVQLAAAQARLLTGWGPALAGHPDLPDLARGLAAGEVALVRIDLPAGEVPSAPPVGARVAPLTEDSTPQNVELLGAAPTVDPQAQGRGYLALWRGAPAPSGTALRAVLTLPGESRNALVLPRSAFVRHAGAVFVYVQAAKGGCEKRVVALGPALEPGLVVSAGVEAGDRVVVSGAQQLLAAELLGATKENGD
jgi:hypothetical protein